MITAAELKAITAPIQAETIRDLGSIVTIRCRSLSRRRDNSSEKRWGTAAADVGCHFFNYTKEQQVREFGREIRGELQGKFAITAHAAPGNGIVVTRGDHSGQRFEIVDVEHAHLGQCSIVGLKLMTCEDFE